MAPERCTESAQFHGIDHAAELGDDAIADQLHDAAVVGGDGWVEDGLSVPLQSSQRARLVGSHQARIADYIGREDCRQFAVDASVGHEECIPGMSGILSAGSRRPSRRAEPFVQQDGELGLASAIKSEMASNRAHRKRRNARPVTLSRARRYQLKSGPIAHVRRGWHDHLQARLPVRLRGHRFEAARFALPLWPGRSLAHCTLS